MRCIVLTDRATRRSVAQVFISYRRNDAGGHAGRIFDRLRQWFDRDALFYDLDSISPETCSLSVSNPQSMGQWLFLLSSVRTGPRS